jgi:2-keto-4-pentenoate hydratase/2-oxohepta-3-ene-1,7-dioic acid hydratase in catechol pathway
MLTVTLRKPNTSLASPWPQPTILPKITQLDDCGDYEAELIVVLGKAAKNVSEADAMEYVLGYTAANDVSSRSSQFAQTQWSFSKGFDGACPIGKNIVCAKRLKTLTLRQVRRLSRRS